MSVKILTSVPYLLPLVLLTQLAPTPFRVILASATNTTREMAKLAHKLIIALLLTPQLAVAILTPGVPLPLVPLVAPVKLVMWAMEQRAKT